MGTTLTGTTPQDTYDSLIKVTDNGPLSGTLKALSDGLGNDSTLSLSTTAASIAGTLAVSGNATFDTNTLFVDAANNRVGVGTVTPTAGMLNVVGAAAANGLTIKSAGNGGTFPLRVTWASGTDGDMLSVNDAGNVGIGTSAPTTAKLVVSGGVTNSIATVAASFGAGGNAVNIGDDGTNGVIGVGNSATDLVILKRVAGVYSESVRFPSTGGLTFNGDTAAANALDDYEEGTWTMGVQFGGASVGVAFAANTGTYTKIGRQVTINGLVVLSSKGSSTGNATIVGLPFPVANGLQFFSALTLRLENITFANQFQGYCGINSSIIELEETTILGVTTKLTNADFANNSTVMVSATYFV